LISLAGYLLSKEGGAFGEVLRYLNPGKNKSELSEAKKQGKTFQKGLGTGGTYDHHVVTLRESKEEKHQQKRIGPRKKGG